MKEKSLSFACKQYRGGSRNLLEVDANIAYDNNGFKDVIFFSIFKNFERSPDNSITMKMDTFMLRVLGEALRTLIIKNASPEFNMVTGATESVKELTLGYTAGDHGDSYFINIKHGEKKLSSPFSLFQIKALLLSLTHLCDSLDDKMSEMTIGRSIKFEKAAALKKGK